MPPDLHQAPLDPLYVRSLWESGLSIRTLATQFHRSQETIRELLSQAGVSPHDRYTHRHYAPTLSRIISKEGGLCCCCTIILSESGSLGLPPSPTLVPCASCTWLPHCPHSDTQGTMCSTCAQVYRRTP